MLTDAIWSEYVNVLNRDKFARFPDFRANADIVLSRLNELAEWVRPIEELAIINDVDDNRFLEAAQAASADYLITGNCNDFTIPTFGVTRIVTPNAYWEEYRSRD